LTDIGCLNDFRVLDELDADGSAGGLANEECEGASGDGVDGFGGGTTLDGIPVFMGGDVLSWKVVR
jgi:hypothetical protein